MKLIKADVSHWLDTAELKIHEPGDIDLFHEAWTRLHERYPDDQDLRESGLLAAAMFLSGELTPQDLGKAVAHHRREAEETLAAARSVGELAVKKGAAESPTAAALGVDRMTLRKWLGKR